MDFNNKPIKNVRMKILESIKKPWKSRQRRLRRQRPMTMTEIIYLLCVCVCICVSKNRHADNMVWHVGRSPSTATHIHHRPVSRTHQSHIHASITYSINVYNWNGNETRTLPSWHGRLTVYLFLPPFNSDYFCTKIQFPFLRFIFSCTKNNGTVEQKSGEKKSNVENGTSTAQRSEWMTERFTYFRELIYIYLVRREHMRCVLDCVTI